MAWEEILPRRGIASGRDLEAVSVAYRPTSSRGRPVVVVTFSGALAKRMGWEAKAAIRAQRDRVAGLVRLSPVDQSEASAWTLERKVDGVAVLKLPMRDLDPLPQQPAALAAHRVEADGAVIVTLPDWAAPERVAAARRAENARLGAERSRIEDQDEKRQRQVLADEQARRVASRPAPIRRTHGPVFQ